MHAIEVSGIRKAFGPVQALSDLGLEVRRGEIFGLLGPNGAGKTTTVRILTTLLRPDAGSARIAGLDVVAEAGLVRKTIGYVPQEITVDPYLTAREHLEYYAGLYHVARKEKSDRIRELLSLVGLESDADRPVRRFSGGMKKKLDLVCGLLHRPEVLLLDEPSLGLDVQIRRDVWNHILNLREQGVTVFLCTNYMDEADALCDRLCILHRGSIVATGNPRDLRSGIQQDSVSIELGDDGERGTLLTQLEEAFQELPFVKRAKRNGRRIEVSVDHNETALPRLLEVTRASRVSVKSVAYSRPGLEDVFLHYTGTGFQEAQESKSEK